MKKDTPKKAKKEMTIDDLAIVVAKGFGDVMEIMDERFEQVDKRFEQVDKRFGQVDEKLKKIDEKINQRFDGLSNRIDDLSMNRSTREETKILEMRVDRIEKALKIK